MNIVRTILWVLILAALLVFSWANWNPGISVRIWPNLVVDTRLPAIVVISFLAGLLPMWLYHRGVVWSLQRRTKALETAQTTGNTIAHNRATGGASLSTTPLASGADHALDAEHQPARPGDVPVPPIRP